VTAGIVSADELRYVFTDPQVRAKAVQRLADEGLSTRKIAALVGTSHTTIERDLGGTDVPKIGTNVTPAERREAVLREQLRLAQTAAVVPDKRYGTIVIDPPWPMKKIEREVRPNQVEFDYPTMDYEALRAFRVKVALLASDNCHVFMWTTQRFLPMALRLFEDYEIKYVLTMVWHKTGGFQPVGLPQYNCEFVLYGRIGTPEFIDTKAFDCCFEAPRTEHSRKPDKFYDLVRRVTPDGRIDVFSREKRDGFDQFGNEPMKFGEAAE